jgi:hypothetical protein
VEECSIATKSPDFLSPFGALYLGARQNILQKKVSQPDSKKKMNTGGIFYDLRGYYTEHHLRA